MQKHFLPFITTIGVILAVAVLIWGFLPQTTDATITDSALEQSIFAPVDGAGTVILRRSEVGLTVQAVFPYQTYVYQVEVESGSRVEVLFHGKGRTVLFTAFLDGGEVSMKSTVLEDDFDVSALDVTPLPAPTSLAGSTTTGSTITSTAAQIVVVTTAPPRTTTTRGATTTVPPATTAASTTTSAPTTTVAPTTTTIPPTTTTTVAPTTTTIPPTTTTTAVPAIPDGIVTYSLGPAGTITVTFLNQKFVEAVINAASGWSVDKADGDSNDILVELVNDDLRTIWEARIQNGQLTLDLTTVEDD